MTFIDFLCFQEAKESRLNIEILVKYNIINLVFINMKTIFFTV